MNPEAAEGLSNNTNNSSFNSEKGMHMRFLVVFVLASSACRPDPRTHGHYSLGVCAKLRTRAPHESLPETLTLKSRSPDFNGVLLDRRGGYCTTISDATYSSATDQTIVETHDSHVEAFELFYATPDISGTNPKILSTVVLPSVHDGYQRFIFRLVGASENHQTITLGLLPYGTKLTPPERRAQTEH